MNRLAGLALLLSSLTAAAETRAYSQACRQQCAATEQRPAGNPTAVQACLIRCQAGADFARSSHAPHRPTAAGRPVARPAAEAGTWAVVYAATPPNPVTGISQGQHDRNLAHVAAERDCSSQAHARCQILAEAGPGECVAVAHAGHRTGLRRTADPRSFKVTLVEAGKGADREEAERAALAACSTRGDCEIVATACGTR